MPLMSGKVLDDNDDEEDDDYDDDMDELSPKASGHVQRSQVEDTYAEQKSPQQMHDKGKYALVFHCASSDTKISLILLFRATTPAVAEGRPDPVLARTLSKAAEALAP